MNLLKRFTLHPHHRRIAKGMFTVALLIGLGKVMGAGKEMAMAWRFGVGAEVDAYLIAMTVITWLPVMLFSVGTVVFVPELVRMRGDEEKKQCFVAEMNGAVVACFVVLLLLLLLIGPTVLDLYTKDLSAETAVLAGKMLYMLSPMLLVTLIGGCFSLRLQARERFGYTLFESMPAVGILLSILLLPSFLDGLLLVVGSLIGGAAQLLLLFHQIGRRDGGFGGLRFSFTSPAWVGMAAALGIMALGQFVTTLATPIDQFFAARAGEGGVAALGYVKRVIALATGMGATAAARALLPVLSDATAKGDLSLARSQTIKWTVLLFGLGLLAAGAGSLLAPWGVRVLFERGAFTHQDTLVVSHLLRIGLWQLPFYIASMVLIQWMVIRRRFRLVFLTWTIGIPAKLLVVFSFLPRYGMDAVMYSIVAMYAVSFFSAATCLKKAEP